MFDAFAGQLPDDFAVFYSVAWLNRSRDGTLNDGETDFVIGHPDRGVLIVEVKGGGIERDGASERWWSIDRTGTRHRIKDPFEQARTSKYALLDKLHDQRDLRGRWIEIGQAVVLPDCSGADAYLGPDAPRQITAFAEDLGAMRRWVEGAFAAYRSDRANDLGEKGMRAIERVLAPTFELKTPLSASLRRDEQRILTLTEEQFAVFDLLSRTRRVAISGGPGSGKSVLAAEKARRLAEEGMETLLVCFNRPLADHLQHAFASEENLTVHTFHSLCKDLAEEAGLLDPGWRDHPSPEFFSDQLPPLMLEALDTLPKRRFDAIVADEGQDFEAGWWELLQLAERDPGNGILYIFFDPGQNVRGTEEALPPGLLPPLTLSRNLRNTMAIHRLARRFAAGQELDPEGPEGRPVEYIAVSGKLETERALSRLLDRLVRREGIRPEDVAVLSGRGQDHSMLTGRERLGAFRCAPPPPREGSLVVDTVRRFKGLDSPVVVLVEIDELLDSQELMRVAATRARSHLAILARADSIEKLRG